MNVRRCGWRAFEWLLGGSDRSKQDCHGFQDDYTSRLECLRNEHGILCYHSSELGSAVGADGLTIQEIKLLTS